LKEASKSFENAIKIKPDFALAHVGLSHAFLLRNRLLDAQVEAQDALTHDPTNADAHYIIGLVRLRAGARDDALEHAKMAIELNPEMGNAYLLKSQCLVGFTATPSDESSTERPAVRKAHYEEAASALEKYLQLTPNGNDNPRWAEQLESLRFHANLLGDELKDKEVFTGNEVTTKARVLNKPEPSYPLAARENRVSGAVILRGVFAADGTVQHLLVLQGLPHGLTEECLKAARQIKFTPASIDGREVSTLIQLEYNFSFY
jgi:TonB family protein